MSRPKLPPELKKTVHVTLSFTDEEMKSIRISAAHDGMDGREWMHRVILDAAAAGSEHDTAPHLVAVPEQEP